MKCEYCGRTLTNNYKYCPECGASVHAEEEPVEEKVETSTTQPAEKPAEKKIPGFGIAGFTLGIIGLCTVSMVCSILGIIFSGIALSKFDTTKHKTKGLVIAGLVLAITGVVVAFFASLRDFTNFNFWNFLFLFGMFAA